MPPAAPTAFFSYSRDDLDFALRLAKDLKKAGANVWMDKLDIRAGQLWERRVEDALDTCPRLLVILSPSSVNSPNVMAEVAFALDEQKEVIPLLHRECKIPFRLRPFQYVDFRSDYSQGLEELLITVGVEQQAAAGAAAAPAAPKESSTTVSEEAPPNQLDLLTYAKEIDGRLSGVKAASPVAEARGEKASLEAGAGAGRGDPAGRCRDARREEERWAAATEKARLEQQERERFERAVSGAPVPSLAMVSPTVKKIALAACPVLLAAFYFYWTWTRPKKHEVGTQTPAVQTQPSSPPPSAEVSSDSAAAKKATADKAAADKAARDKAAAVKQQATESLSAQAMFDKAVQYDSGPKSTRDPKQALIWYHKAANAGNKYAMWNLALKYYRGDGVDKDYNQAASWFRKCANAGSGLAMYNLGSMYENGTGVERDLQQAIAWYRKAAQLGTSDAEDALKRLGESP